VAIVTPSFLGDAMIKVTITKTLEEWWGVDDLLAEFNVTRVAGAPAEAITDLISMLMEDTTALLDGAEFEFEDVP
jgi:hypothetical protein